VPAFKKISHFVGRLESGPRVVGQEYGLVPVFKFSFLQPGECPRWGGKFSGRGKCPGEMCPRGMFRENSYTLLGWGH